MNAEQRKLLNKIKKELKPVLKKFIGEPVDPQQLRIALSPFIKEYIEFAYKTKVVDVRNDPVDKNVIIATIQFLKWRY